MDYNFSNSIQNPYDGSIQLKNKGSFTARIHLVYTLKTSKYRTSKTEEVPKNQTKKIVIPEGAHTIFYYIEYKNALRIWRELHSDTLHEPTIICFETSGSSLSPKCKEVDCPDGTSGINPPTPTKPCCKCKCCRCCCRKPSS